MQRLVPSTFSFFHHFPSHVLEALSTFRVLNLPHVYSHSLGGHLALNLFVHNNAKDVLDDIVDSSQCCCGGISGELLCGQCPFL